MPSRNPQMLKIMIALAESCAGLPSACIAWPHASRKTTPYHWQPLTYFNGSKVVTPAFVGAQWYRVTPFALTSPDQLLPFVSRYGPALFGSAEYREQARELVDISAHLTDEQKMIAEY